MSLEQLGERLRVSRQSVWQWEENRTVPRSKRIQQICKVLEVSPEYFHGTSPPPQPESLEAKIGRLQPAQRAVIEAATDAFLAEEPKVKRSVK